MDGFDKGWMELYYHKLRLFLSSVQKAIIDKRVKEMHDIQTEKKDVRQKETSKSN